MLTSVLSVLCAAALSVSHVSNQADTTNVYFINGKAVENFDGSQLVGKTISAYRTGISDDKEHGTLKIHMIQTTAGQDVQKTDAQSFIIAVGKDGKTSRKFTATSSNNTDVFINGKKSSREAMKKISPENIATVKSFTAGSKEAIELTSHKDKSALVIELK